MRRFGVAILVLFALGAEADEAARRDDPAPSPPEKILLLLKQTDQIAKTVSASRGLELRAPLQKKSIAQEEVRQKLLKSLKEETEPGELEAQAIALKKLGLLERGADYKKLILDLLTEQIAGFYDSDDKTLYLVNEVAPERGALAHEIGHAIQDQHFNLGALHDAFEEKGSDAQLALSALIEGDAMGIMLDDQLRGVRSFASIPDLPEKIRQQSKSEGDSSSTQLDSAPPILRETLVFPYIEGLVFVFQLRQMGSWSVIDEVFANPPTSTEQILHPEKYLQGDQPSEVPIFSLRRLKKTHQRVYEDTIGELQWRIYFEQALSPKEASEAAAGWDGDRLIALTPKNIPAEALGEGELDSTLVAIATVWDSEEDAREAEEALRKVALARYPGYVAEGRGVLAPSSAAPGAPRVLILRKKKRVLYAEGMTAPALEAVRKDLLNVAKKIKER